MSTGTIRIIDAAGSTSPTGFTKQGGATTEFTVRDSTALPGGKYIELNDTAANKALSVNAVGNANANMEILILVRSAADTDNKQVAPVHLRATNWLSGSHNYYAAYLRKANSGSTQQFRLSGRVAGVETTYDFGIFSWSVNTWYAVRYRVEGNDISARVWQPVDLLDPTVGEPETWLTATTQTDITGAGYMAFGVPALQSVVYDYLPLGWATNGDTAPAPVFPAQKVYPESIVEANGWTGSAADIDDSGVPDDSNFIESPLSPTTAMSVVIRALPAIHPGVDINHKYIVRAWRNVISGNPTLKVTPVWRTGYVNSGSRGTVIRTGTQVTLTNTPTNISLVPTEAEIANIPDGEYATGVFCELIPEQT